MAWQWPPYVATPITVATGFTTHPHYRELDIQVSGNLKIIFNNNNNGSVQYVDAVQGGARYSISLAEHNQYGRSYPLSYATVTLNSFSAVPTPPAWTGFIDNDFTPVNSTTPTNPGASGANATILTNTRVDHDFSQSISHIAGVKSGGTYLFTATDIQGTYIIADPDLLDGGFTSLSDDMRVGRMQKVAATKYLLVFTRWLQLQGNNNYQKTLGYCIFDTSATTLSSPANLPNIPTGLQAGLETFDAGEGYYYVTYVDSANQLCIRGIDCSSGTPVVTGLLGGSGTASFSTTALALDGEAGTSNNCRRYLSVGANRVIAFIAGDRFVRLTFTQAAKSSPTVVTSVRTSTGTGRQIHTEYDPNDTSQFYLVRWSVLFGTTIEISAEYINVLGTVTSNFQGYQLVTSYLNPQYDFAVSTYGASAALGDAQDSFIGLTFVNYNGVTDVPTTVVFPFVHWHTPTSYDRSVTVTSTYSSVVINTPGIVRERSVGITSSYGSVDVRIALPAFFADQYRWAVEASSIFEYGVAINSAYTSVSLTGVALELIEVLPLNQHWLNVGHTWMDDFMVYVNQDRQAVGLPRYKTWGEDGQFLLRKDVAQLHAGTMARLKLFAHEGPGITPGEVTIPQRGDLMPSTGIAENLQISAFYNLTTNTPNPGYLPTGFTTAYDAWLNWHNSPVHYANIIFNWGGYNNVVYSLMGIEEGLPGSDLLQDYPVLADWKLLYLCNNFVALETAMYEIPLGQTWSNTGALIASLDQQWDNDSWVHVAQRYEAPYAIRVASQNFVAEWGCRVAAQNAAPITYSAAVLHTAPYEPAIPVVQPWVEFPYAIKNTVQVVAQNEVKYGLTLARFHTGPYALLLPVKNSNEAGYRIFDTEPVAQRHESSYSVTVAAQSQNPYALLTPVRQGYEAQYSIKDTQAVAQQNELPFALRVAGQSSNTYAILTPLRKAYEAAYAIKDTQPVTTQSEGVYALSVSAQQSAEYALLFSVKRSLEAGYAIKDTQPVVKQHEVEFALRVTKHSSADYALMFPVRTSYEAGYRIKDTGPVAQQNEVAYALRVGYQHTASYTQPGALSGAHAVGYSLMLPVASSVETGYSIKDTQPVLKQHEAEFALRVTRQASVDYALLLTVRSSNEAGYRVKDTGPVAQQNEAQYALRVSYQHVAPYTEPEDISTTHEVGYSLMLPVAAAVETGYAIKNTQPVLRSHEAPFALTVSAHLSLPYAILKSVATQHDSPYAIKNTQPVNAQSEAKYSLTLTANYAADYALLTPVRISVEAPYAVKATQPIARQHEAGFALRVTAILESDYAVLYAVAQRQEAPFAVKDTQPLTTQSEIKYALSVAQHHASNYAVLFPVRSSHEAGYSVKDTQPIAKQHEAPFGLRLMGVAEASYALMWSVRQVYEAGYSVKDTQPVAAQQESKYSLRVGQQNAALYSEPGTIASSHESQYSFLFKVGARNEIAYAIKDTQPVTVQNSAPFALRVSTAAAFDYALLSPLSAQNEVGYTLKDTQPVARQHEAGFALKVTRHLAADYALLLPVGAAQESPYAVKDTQPIAKQHESVYALRLSQQHQLPYTQPGKLQAQHELAYALLRPIAASTELGYAIKNTQPVQAHVQTGYALAVSAVYEAFYALLTPTTRQNEALYSVKNTQPTGQQHEAAFALRVAYWHDADYAVLSPVRTSLEAGYSVKDTGSVSAQNSAEFALRVAQHHDADYAMLYPIAAEHEAEYAVKDTSPVRAQNSADFALRVAQHYEADYTLLQSVKAQSEAGYAIKDTQGVARQHEAEFALRVTQVLAANYALLLPVRGAYEAPYAVKDTQPIVKQHEVNYAVRLASQHELPYTQPGPLQAAHETSYSLMRTVVASNEITYAIKNTQPAHVQMQTGYSLTVSAVYESTYALLTPAAAQSEAPYAVKNTQPISQQHEAGFALRVAYWHDSDYAVLTPVRTVYEAGYAVKDTGPVSAQNSAEFALRVAQHNEASYVLLKSIRTQNESSYAVKDTGPVSAQNSAEFALRVAQHHDVDYAVLYPVAAEHEAGYAVKDTSPVHNQNSAEFALRVSTHHEVGYTLLQSVKAQSEAGYLIKDTAPIAVQNEAPFALSVARQHETAWTINTSVRAQSEAKYGDVVPVRTQAQIDYALLQTNPLKVQMSHYYGMQDYLSQIVASNVVTLVLADGQTLRVDDGVIESAEGDVGYSFECTIADVSTFANINEDDPIVVNFCGELYNFVINGKSMTRDGPASVSMRITADNAVARLGQPYAQEIDFVQNDDIAASALVDALVEINFNYQLVDWTVLSGRLQVAGATTLEAVGQIAEATGGVVDGTPTGSMLLRYPYPHPMNALGTATVDQYYADDYDNLSVSIQTQYRDGATKFRVREGDAAYSDSLEWVPDEKQDSPTYQTGIVKAYLSPYRTTARIAHLGNAAYVNVIGEEIEYNEELVEFNEGVGNTKRPIETLLSIEWFTTSMGTPAYSPFSTLLNANPTVNKGYGLAKVRYNARHLTARAGGVPFTVEASGVGPASSYAYFILEELNG